MCWRMPYQIFWSLRGVKEIQNKLVLVENWPMTWWERPRFSSSYLVVILQISPSSSKVVQNGPKPLKSQLLHSTLHTSSSPPKLSSLWNLNFWRTHELQSRETHLVKLKTYLHYQHWRLRSPVLSLRRKGITELGGFTIWRSWNLHAFEEEASGRNLETLHWMNHSQTQARAHIWRSKPQSMF